MARHGNSEATSQNAKTSDFADAEMILTMCHFGIGLISHYYIGTHTHTRQREREKEEKTLTKFNIFDFISLMNLRTMASSCSFRCQIHNAQM